MATTQERSPSKSKRRVTAAAVPKSMIEKASLTLADLPEKPKEALQLREAIQLLVDPITAALEKGYSREEIVSLLNDKGIEITTASLQYYLLRFRQQAPKTRGKVRKPRRKKGELPTSAETTNGATPPESAVAELAEVATSPKSDTSESATPATETAPKKRRGPAKGSTPKTSTRRAAAKDKPAAAETVVEAEKPAKTTRKPRATKTEKAPKATAKKTSTQGVTARKPRTTKSKTT